MSEPINYEPIEIERTIRDTAEAILCVIDGEEHWIPWSVFEEDAGDIDRAGDSGTAYIAEWWLATRNLL